MDKKYWKEFEIVRPRVGQLEQMVIKVINIRVGFFTSVGNTYG